MATIARKSSVPSGTSRAAHRTFTVFQSSRALRCCPSMADQAARPASRPRTRESSNEFLPEGTSRLRLAIERSDFYLGRGVRAVRRLTDPGGAADRELRSKKKLFFFVVWRQTEAAQRRVGGGLRTGMIGERAEQLFARGDRFGQLPARGQAFHRVRHVPRGPGRLQLLAQRGRVPIERRRARVLAAPPRSPGLLLELVRIRR